MDAHQGSDMHHEAAAIALKPLIIAFAVSGAALLERIFAQTDIGQTFEAIGIYGLPTVLVVYFIARDWYRETVAEKNKKEHEAQTVKDKEALALATENDKQRSHENRINQAREQSQMIAAERAMNHELQMAIVDFLRHGHVGRDRVEKITDSTRQHLKQGNSQ